MYGGKLQSFDEDGAVYNKGPGWLFWQVRYADQMMLELTGAQGRGRDLDLTGPLVGLECRGSTPGADVGGKQVGALSPRGAGAGSIPPVVRLLLVIHGNQLEGRQRARGRNTLARLPAAGVDGRGLVWRRTDYVH